MERKINREDRFTLAPHDLQNWRAYTLRAQIGARSKAEKVFDLALNEPTRPGYVRKYKKVDKKDWAIVIGLLDEFWRLQHDIQDEDNSDAQMQRVYIEQQNDILEELERVYKKYLLTK